MNGHVLIQGGCVLTLGTRTQNHTQADVLIDNGVVVEIGNGLRARNAEVIDATNTIVMPGFVDGHRRCWPSLFKNEGTVTVATEPAPDDVYAGTLVSLLGAAESGVTTVVDWYDGPSGDAHIEAALRAHDDAGVRTVLVLAPSGDAVGIWGNAVDRHGLTPSATTTLAAGIASIAEDDSDRVAVRWRAARGLGLRVHTMAGPGERGRFAGLDQSGLLDSDTTVSHCTGLADADLDAIAAGGAGVVLTPTSDMTSGPGTPPVQSFLDRDIRIGLGVDTEVVGPGDILAQMRSAISIQHATYFDLKLAGKGGLPNLLTTRGVIKSGTIDGAHAVGLEATTGSIEVGKAADLIVLRTDKPNIHPVNDPIGAVVWGVDTSNLDWVFVGGVALMRDGILGADVSGAGRLVQDARRRIGAASTSGGTSRGDGG